jgi:dolichol-phosphate mannosyltransferase
MAQKSLSLIIPCYNEERFLSDCVSRVLSLASADLALQVIIVDDCSKDQSLVIAQQLARRHSEILVLRHQRNCGKGAALRTGIMHETLISNMTQQNTESYYC